MSLGGGRGTPSQLEKGLDLGADLGSFWGPFGDPLGPCGDPWRLQVAKKCLRGSPKRGLKRVRKEIPKNNRFWIPLKAAQVSSRQGESTVFNVLCGSFFGSFLDPFWDGFGPRS